MGHDAPAARRWWAVLLVATLGAGVLMVPAGPLGTSVPPPRRPPASVLPWLSVREGRIVDPESRTVLLRGFDVSALMEPAADPQPLDDEDLTLMREAGMDVIRVPVTWARLEPQPGRFDSAYLDEVEALVQRCVAHGLYVVLDMHFLGWSGRYPHQAGAPAWATVGDVPDIEWGLGSAGKYFSPAVNAGLAVFWLSSGWQSELLRAWQVVARRFRDTSGVAGYDLFNEPHAIPLPPVLFERWFLWPFYARTIDAVGAVDPNHLFIVEGVFEEDFGTTMVTLHAPNLVYSAHLYAGSLVPPRYSGDRGPLERQVAMEAAEARRLGAPLWAGEIGIDHRQRLAAQWADAVLDAYDDVGAGWGWWQWREDGGWGIRTRPGTWLDLAFLSHVARPYLAAAPAGVTAGEGDGVHGRIDLHVAATHAQDPVELAWPTLVDRPPQVQGACLAGAGWQPAASRLSLTLVGGRGCPIAVRAG